MFNNVGIVGVGLIGASFALEIKRNNLSDTVIGFDKDEKSLEFATEKGIIDGFGKIEDIGVCDFVIVATPVSNIAGILKVVFDKLRDGSVVIDVGSIKGSIVKSILPFLRENIHYVPIHPIAGIEKFGAKAATKNLFKDAYCIITPFEGIDMAALKKTKDFINALGMHIEELTPQEHDKVFAYISHLPHLIAYGLVGLIKEKNDDKFKFIGGGFRDFTRIAASSEKMWSDIFLLNKKELIKSLNEYQQGLDRLKAYIENDDVDKLMDFLKKARLFKESLDDE